MAIVGPVRQELLSGIRDEAVFERLREQLRAFDDEALSEDDYEEAARIGNRCRSVGVAGSAVDFLVCAAAERRGLAVFTSDADFERYSRVVPLTLHHARQDVGKPAGEHRFLAQLAVFAAVLACFGAAFAVPTSALRARRIAERDASVLGASVLVLGLGGMNLAFAAASAANGDVTSAALLFSVAPVASGLLGLLAVRRRLAGAGRVVGLVRRRPRSSSRAYRATSRRSSRRSPPPSPLDCSSLVSCPIRARCCASWTRDSRSPASRGQGGYNARVDSPVGGSP